MQPRSTRLNQFNKDKFTRAVVDATLPDSTRPTENLFKEKWKKKVFDIVYGEYKETIAKMPDWMTEKSSNFRTHMPNGRGGHSVMIFDTGTIQTLPKGASSGGYGTSVTAPIPENHKMAKDYAQLNQNMEDWNLKKRELLQMLRKLTDSCNTSGQLYAAWPEAVKYSDCFPYVGPNRHVRADVSSTEMDLGILMSGAVVSLPDDEG
jgi:hypothetical protein